jgi:hypothetical protein
VAGFTSQQKATRTYQLRLKYKGLPEDEAKAAVDRDLAAWIDVHEKGGKLTKHGARFPDEERVKKKAKGEEPLPLAEEGPKGEEPLPLPKPRDGAGRWAAYTPAVF